MDVLSMSRVFVISDTHFGHKRIIEFEAAARPFATIEDHDRELVARWNAVVTKRDTVWHLGDVFFGKDGHKALGELNGYKRLVLGNHDHYSLAVYQQYFAKIYGAAEYRHCILTHVPIHENQMYRYEKNVHGHMHSKSIPDPRWVCVSAEHTGLAPILMDTVIGSTNSGEPK
jgi:calcineurin-like phosphoesterase family protein